MGSGERVVYFNTLPQSDRERLAHSLQMQGGPKPYAAEHSKGPAWFMMWALPASIAIGYILLCEIETVFLGWIHFIILIFASCFAVVGLLGFWRALGIREALPFPPGQIGRAHV